MAGNNKKRHGGLVAATAAASMALGACSTSPERSDLGRDTAYMVGNVCEQSEYTDKCYEAIDLLRAMAKDTDFQSFQAPSAQFHYLDTEEQNEMLINYIQNEGYSSEQLAAISTEYMEDMSVLDMQNRRRWSNIRDTVATAIWTAYLSYETGSSSSDGRADDPTDTVIDPDGGGGSHHGGPGMN